MELANRFSPLTIGDMVLTESWEVLVYLSEATGITYEELSTLDSSSSYTLMLTRVQVSLAIKYQEDARLAYLIGIAPHKKHGKGEAIFSQDELYAAVSGITRGSILKARSLVKSLTESNDNKKEKTEGSSRRSKMKETLEKLIGRTYK